MAAYEDRIQALMDEVYSEWQKDENKGKAKWDVLAGFSEAHQIAVVLGNFNYQVGNGGISQWIYNRYFYDDSEKLTEFLEIGAKSDERCKTILDKVHTLDRYAQETDCDREGYFSDDDGENSFIGDMIDGDAFDTWYYANCDGESWWQVVCGIIDEVKGREWTIKAEYIYQGDGGERLSETVYYPTDEETIARLSEDAILSGIQKRVFYSETMESVIPGLENILPDSIGFDELNRLAIKIRDMDAQDRGKFATAIKHKCQYNTVGEVINLSNHLDNPAAYLPLRIYIENIHDDSIGGFTIPLPTTPDALHPFLDGAEITGWQDMKIWETISDIGDLGDVVSDGVRESMSPHTLDELNYLAAKIQTMSSGELEIFTAALEAKRHCDSVAEIINLTFSENLNRFDLLPAFTNEHYGEFLIEQVGVDAHADAFNRLENSDSPDDKALAAYIEKLEKYVDRKAYGRDAIKEENGSLTKNGLLMGGDGIQELYRGSQDIPAEYRLFMEPGEVVKHPMKLENADIAVMIMELHAVSDGEIAFTEGSLRTLSKGMEKEYLLSVDRGEVFLSSAVDAYKRGTEEAASFLQSSRASEERKDVHIFAVHVTNRDNSGVIGDIIKLNAKALHANLTRHGVAPDRIDAVFSNGAAKSYDLWAWAELPSYARGDIRDYEPHYPDSALLEAGRHFASFTDANEAAVKSVSMDTFLSEVNAVYMSAAENPQPDMLRITNDAAKEILARGDADVYRLMPEGAEKLAPIEAARSLCFAEHKELAIKREDSAGLDKWAKRTADKIIRQNERGEHKKVHDAQL